MSALKELLKEWSNRRIATKVQLQSLIGVLVFGFYNPGAALLEGAELIRWRKMGLEAKTIPHPKDTVAIADPTAPIPLPNHPDRNDQ